MVGIVEIRIETQETGKIGYFRKSINTGDRVNGSCRSQKAPQFFTISFVRGVSFARH